MESTPIGIVNFYDLLKLQMKPEYVGQISYRFSTVAESISVAVTRTRTKGLLFKSEQAETVYLSARDLDMKTPHFFVKTYPEALSILADWGVAYRIEEVENYPQWLKSRD